MQATYTHKHKFSLGQDNRHIGSLTLNESPSDQFVEGHGKLDKSLFAALGTPRHPDLDLGHSRVSGSKAGRGFPGPNQQKRHFQIEVAINTASSSGEVFESNREERARLTVSPYVLLSWREKKKKRNRDLPLPSLPLSSSSAFSIQCLNVSKLVSV